MCIIYIAYFHCINFEDIYFNYEYTITPLFLCWSGGSGRKLGNQKIYIL